MWKLEIRVLLFRGAAFLDEGAAILLNTDQKNRRHSVRFQTSWTSVRYRDRESLQYRVSNPSVDVLLQRAGAPFRPRRWTVLRLVLSYRRGHIYETSSSHLHILDARSTFRTEDRQTLGAAVLNSVARSTSCPGLCTPGLVDLQQRYFGGTNCLYFSAQIEKISSSETSVSISQKTRRQTPEDSSV